jgi:hypothetical protein
VWSLWAAQTPYEVCSGAGDGLEGVDPCVEVRGEVGVGVRQRQHDGGVSGLEGIAAGGQRKALLGGARDERGGAGVEA